MKKNITTKDLARLGMLIAITVILGMFFTIRPTPALKIPTKFISVSISAMLFGPVWGGIVGGLSDLISYALNPVAGALLPQITVVEFLYGFTYGLFLKNVISSKNGYLKGFLCVVFQMVFLHALLTTYLLTPVFNMNFMPLFISRIPGFIINLLLQIIGIFFVIKFSDRIRMLGKGDN